MMRILQSLDAIRFEPNTVIFSELDEIREMYFFMNGTFEIGFEINRMPHSVLRYENSLVRGQLIGAYGCTFDKRSFFLYKTKTECEGFFTRKH